MRFRLYSAVLWCTYTNSTVSTINNHAVSAHHISKNMHSEDAALHAAHVKYFWTTTVYILKFTLQFKLNIS